MLSMMLLLPNRPMLHTKHFKFSQPFPPLMLQAQWKSLWKNLLLQRYTCCFIPFPDIALTLTTFQVAFNSFVPHHVSHPFFKELPPAALTAINSFSTKHPDYEMPAALPRLVGLVARVKDSLQGPAKKGKSSWLSSLSFSYFVLSCNECSQPSPRKG